MLDSPNITWKYQFCWCVVQLSLTVCDTSNSKLAFTEQHLVGFSENCFLVLVCDDSSEPTWRQHWHLPLRSGFSPWMSKGSEWREWFPGLRPVYLSSVRMARPCSSITWLGLMSMVRLGRRCAVTMTRSSRPSTRSVVDFRLPGSRSWNCISSWEASLEAWSDVTWSYK